jgi:hypothetical protein
MPEKGMAHTKNTENSAHESELDLDIYIYDDDRLADISSRGEKPPGENTGPAGAVSSSSSSSPDFIKTVKAESAAAGFFIPDNLARHLAATTGPPWLSGPHSYFRFVAGQLHDQYRNADPPKTGAEMRNLYLAALREGWESYRTGYPAWRERREAAAAAAAAAREAALLERHPPEVCPGCGGPVEDRVCSRCHGRVRFREDPPSWDFLPSAAEAARELVKGLEKIRRKEVPKTAPEGLDF